MNIISNSFKIIFSLIYILIQTSEVLCQDTLTSTYPFKSILDIDSDEYQKLLKFDSNQIQYNTLRVSMKVYDEVLQQGFQPCLVLAETDIPSAYDVKRFFESDRVKDKVDMDFQSNYNIDIEACTMVDNVHYIEILPPFQNNFYKLSILDLSLQRREYQVEITIDFLNTKNDQQCPDQCSFDKYQDDTNQCNQGKCQCSDQYIGEKCQVKTTVIEDDGKKISVVVNPQKWVSYKINIPSVTDFTLNVIELRNPSNLSILKLGYSMIGVPNFSHDFYNMPSSNDQNYQIGDEIKDYETYAQQNPTAKLALVFSFYNPNEKPIAFSFRVSSNGFDDEQSGSVLQNVLVIVICVIGVICLIPFVYICITSFSKKNQQQVSAIQNPANLVQENNLIPQGGLSMQQRRTTIAKEVVDKYMPIQIYTELTQKYPILKEISECVICLTEFEEENKCRMTTCYHLFHQDCLEGWFKLHDNCPFCRMQLTEKAIKENKDKDQNNSYVHRITNSIASDNKTVLERLNEFDSPQSVAIRNRAVSTEESSRQNSNENILKTPAQKRSRFANNFLDQEDYVLDQSQNERQRNIEGRLDNSRNDDNTLQLNDSNVPNSRVRSESAQIPRGLVEPSRQRTELNRSNLQIPQRVTNAMQSINQNTTGIISRQLEINQSREQDQQNQGLNQNNNDQVPERVINLDNFDYGPIMDFSSNLNDQNERSPALSALNAQKNKQIDNIRNSENTPSRRKVSTNSQNSQLRMKRLQSGQSSKLQMNQQSSLLQEERNEESKELKNENGEDNKTETQSINIDAVQRLDSFQL